MQRCARLFFTLRIIPTLLMAINGMFNRVKLSVELKICSNRANKGGHLASVTSKEDQSYMFERVSQNPVWIGATDKKREGFWEWTDCSPFNFTGWVTGEPSEGNKENCLELYRTDRHHKGWNDLQCDISLNFVCSINICQGRKRSFS